MDWKQLLKELDEAGMTQTQIAETCGTSQATVSDLARGVTKNPSFSIGAAVVELHKRAFMRQRRPSKAQQA